MGDGGVAEEGGGRTQDVHEVEDAHSQLTTLLLELVKLNVVLHTVPNLNIVSLVWFGFATVLVKYTYAHKHTPHHCHHSTWYFYGVVFF